MRKQLASLAFVWLLANPPARADDTLPNASEELRLIESVERNEDPLGLDESTGKGLDEAARKLKVEREKPVLPTPSQGEVVATIDRVNESAHEVDISLEQG